MFSRVLVANRGEVAVRVIRALHELGIEAVAVYSTADEDALHVRLADRAVRIGPPPAARELPARSRRSSPRRRRPAARRSIPGYGLPRREPRVRRARARRTTSSSSGPTPDVMERMGDKAQAKAEMAAAGVPLVPGTEGGATVARGPRRPRASSATPCC